MPKVLSLGFGWYQLVWFSTSSSLIYSCWINGHQILQWQEQYQKAIQRQHPTGLKANRRPFGRASIAGLRTAQDPFSRWRYYLSGRRRKVRRRRRRLDHVFRRYGKEERKRPRGHPFVPGWRSCFRFKEARVRTIRSHNTKPASPVSKRQALNLEIKKLKVFGDSQLIISQINGKCKRKQSGFSIINISMIWSKNLKK